MTVIQTPNKIPVVNLELAQGADFTMTFLFWQDEAKTIPLDLTGWTFTSDIRRRVNGNVLKHLTNGSGITNGGTNGQVLYKIAGADTALFPSPKVVSDLFAAGPASATVKFWDMVFAVIPRVTQ